MDRGASRQALGLAGERRAAAELVRRGYAILATRYRTRFGEIDIVAEEAATVVFVEVKARRTKQYGEAAEALPYWKRRRIGAMALDYLARTKRLETACRFDVVAIDGFGTNTERISVIRDAFSVR